MFGVLMNLEKPGAADMAEEIRAYLSKRGRHVVVTDGSEPIPYGIRCLVVIGGDGTLLRAAKQVVGRNLPLLGVNLGTLGYMAEVEASAVEPALDQLLTGRYFVEQRMMLEGSVFRGEECIAREIALNDVVIIRSGPLRILQFRNFVNGSFLTDYQADGIILSTPTGSTGYSLSVGGPIVTPLANLILMTPVAPHTLASRSIILRGSDRVTVEIGWGHAALSTEVAVSFDGGDQVTAESGDRVEVCRSEQTTSIIKLSDASFLDTLRRKLADR